MATFNGERYLREQLDSIIKQEGMDLNFLFCDDGSSDGTVGILEEFSRNYPVLEIYEVKNSGHVNTFAYLTKHAPEGFDYYAYSDQDDVWDVDKLQKSFLAFENTAPTIVGSARRIVKGKQAKVAFVQKPFGPSFSNALVQNNLYGNTCIVNAKGLAFLKEYLPDEQPYFDGWLYFIFSSCAQVRLIEEPLISYRVHNDNSIGIRKISKIVDMNNQVEKYYQQAKKGKKFVRRFLHHQDKTLLFDFLAAYEEKNILKKFLKLRNLQITRSKKTETLAFKFLMLIHF
jgi:glycosyltransferase involved in cell wall biosynthesis